MANDNASTRLLQRPEAPLLSEISDTGVRNGFVRKVYSILLTQLLLTTIIGGLLMQELGPMMESNPTMVVILMWLSLILSISMLCLFACNPSLTRQVPINYIILFIFTLAESVTVGFICSAYTVPSVLMVFALTAFVVVGLTIYACKSSVDFTGAGPYLLCFLLVLLGMGFCLSFASMLGLAGSPAFRVLNLVYAGLGALLFSFYIVYDTQLIVGGKHQQSNQFGIDDYCMAAISLYLDIINLFVMLLSLFGERK